MAPPYLQIIQLSAEDHIRAGAHLNQCWDGESVRERLQALTIPLDRAGSRSRPVRCCWPRPPGAVTVTYKLFSGYTPDGSYWQLAQGILNPAGRLVPTPNGLAVDGIPVGSLPLACAASVSGVRPTPSCRQALAAFHAFITYQPASRYWAFQGIEFGIFAALAALLVAVTTMVLLRRDV